MFYSMCAPFFSLINTTKLFDLVSFVISRIFCILHNISCISCFCDFSCCAFLAATKSHCLPSREPNQLDLSDLFLWFSLLCISYNFCQRGCGCVDVDEWMWMSGCSPLTTSHRRSSIRTIHEARPYCTASASSLGQSRPMACKASQAGSWGHDKVQVGTFWGVPNVLLRASGAQLGLDIVAQ